MSCLVHRLVIVQAAPEVPDVSRLSISNTSILGIYLTVYAVVIMYFCVLYVCVYVCLYCVRVVCVHALYVCIACVVHVWTHVCIRMCIYLHIAYHIFIHPNVLTIQKLSDTSCCEQSPWQVSNGGDTVRF